VRRGLADPVFDAQRVFRAVLHALAHPGRVVTLDRVAEAPPPLMPASTAVCLALLDFETPLWLSPDSRGPDVLEWLRFHCGVPVVDEPAAARFGLITEPALAPPLDLFDAGTDGAPDRSATVVMQVGALVEGAGVRLAGPGIASEVRLDVTAATPFFWEAVRANGRRFPRGVDFLLAAGPCLAALPRTVRVER
jgi:alpha-D-ribose 1-methylphosphonate 5-triphosphate synthase subunit PhnH